MIRSIVHDNECIFHGGLTHIRRESMDAIFAEHPDMRPDNRWGMIVAEIAYSAVFFGIEVVSLQQRPEPR